MSIRLTLTFIAVLGFCTTVSSQREFHPKTFGRDYKLTIEGKSFDNNNYPTGTWTYIYRPEYNRKQYAKFNYETGKYVLYAETWDDSDQFKFLEKVGYYDKNFKKTGEWKIYDYNNDEIKESGSYVNDKKSGQWILNSTYGDEDTKVISYYVDGLKEGVSIQYFKEGGVDAKRTNKYVNDKIVGPEVIYIINGEKETKFRQTDYTDGSKAASYVFDENGNIQEKSFYAPDNSRYPYKKQIFYPSGQLFSDTLLSKGKNDGIETKYYDSGIVYSKIRYENNKIMEVLALNDNDGITLDHGTLNKGNGTLKIYDEDGQLSVIYTIEDGIPVSKVEK